LLWSSSPALAELAEVTMRWLGAALGLPGDWFGMIHDTASTSTFHAIIAARELAASKACERGAELDLNRIVMYTSEHAHSSVEKAMSALGRGAEACRKIRCDDRYSMRPDELEQAIAADLAEGLAPIAVAATVGTTASTGIDPVEEIAEIAARHGLWLHVDAAYAGAAAILPEMRHHFAGCERADSFVMNPHKWLFVQMDCSAFYTARPGCLRRALSLTPEVLRSRQDPRAVNYMEHSIALGRRFRALKLWYVLRSFGVEHLSAVLREHIRLAGLLAGWVQQAPDFELLAPVDFSLVCLRYLPQGATEVETNAANERLLQAINATGEFFLSHAKLEGRYAIRVAIGNLNTTESHVRRLWELFQDLARHQP
jgi:aromatic-L-amino-acid decarboxylase